MTVRPEERAAPDPQADRAAGQCETAAWSSSYATAGAAGATGRALDERSLRMWTLAFGHHEDRTPTHGYEPTREAAMAAFAKSWRRE
jgi:hypothetical protein